MPTAIKSPKNCGYSTKIGKIYLCSMDVKPCPLNWDKEAKCAIDRMDEQMKRLAKALWGDQTE